MKTHYLALTIDTDPDGLSTNTPDRRNLIWDGLYYATETFPDALSDYPLTWYVRADGQLEYAYGSVRYLLDKHANFWHQEVARGGELGWHPHLYRVAGDGSEPEIIIESNAAIEELSRIWQELQDVPFDFPTFRMGEGWHTAETLNLVESLGFTVDGTAIPGRDDSAGGHPRNWSNTPNRPYYPDKNEPRLEGTKRNLLEIPMNTWYFQTSYDAAPKLRYMNPCIHTDLWEQALNTWQKDLSSGENNMWVMILHPGEAMPRETSDLLYAHSIETMQKNLALFEQKIIDSGYAVERVTVSEMAKVWKAQH